MLVDIDFEYQDDDIETKSPKIQYKARGQIRRGKSYTREENDIEITIGEAGDTFPCILIKYIFSSNMFRIVNIRKVNWGGSKEDESVLCINPPLPNKGSLDILVNLSLEIIYKLIEINDFEKEPDISINDNAFINNYPLSWLKYKTKKDYLNKNTYGKFGFQLREPNESNKFKEYITEKVPEYLNKSLSEIIVNKIEFTDELNKINRILTKKKRKNIEYNPTEKLSKFIDKIFSTELIKNYDNLMKIINQKYRFDIRGEWYLDKEFFSNSQRYHRKVNILNFNVI